MKKNRIPWGKEPFIKEEKLSREQFEENYGTCHDCGAKFEEIHDYGCDMEECPVCHGQFMGCGKKCLDKIKNYKDILSDRNSSKDVDIEYVKPFFPCDPTCVKKEKKEGFYILPGGEYCL
jgi:hypothetical protein